MTFPVDVHSTDPGKDKGIMKEGVRAKPYDIPYRALIARDYQVVHFIGHGGFDRKKGGRTIMSTTMIWTGAVTIVFIILHLLSLKFGELQFNEEGQVDFHAAVGALLAAPGYAIWYIVATWIVGVHVSHALQSSLRTLGLNNKRIEGRLKAISIAFGWIVAAGYSSIPIWLLIRGGA